MLGEAKHIKNKLTLLYLCAKKMYTSLLPRILVHSVSVPNKKNR